MSTAAAPSCILLPAAELQPCARGLQARQVLAAMLRAQLDQKRAALQRVRQAASQVDSLMAAAAQQLEQALGDSAQSEARPQGMMELG